MRLDLAAFFLLATPLACSAPTDLADSALASAIAHPGRTDADRERDATSRPLEILDFFGVAPGMRVLDLLSGEGYYSEILSRTVGPAGSVVAHTNDIHEKYLGDEIALRYRDERLPNVDRLISNAPDLALPASAFDVVWMIMIYHDIYYVSETNPKHPKIDRDHYLAQIRRSLKPGGVLAVVDHCAKLGTGSSAAQDLHRIDEQFAMKDIEAAGFVFDGQSDVLRNAGDDRTLLVFDERIRRKTDRFVYRFVKPED